MIFLPKNLGFSSRGLYIYLESVGTSYPALTVDLAVATAAVNNNLGWLVFVDSFSNAARISCNTQHNF